MEPIHLCAVRKNRHRTDYTIRIAGLESWLIACRPAAPGSLAKSSTETAEREPNVRLVTGLETRRPKWTVPHCAHPRSRTIALGSDDTGVQTASIGAENQRGSQPCHSILVAVGRSLNQRVAGSSPARLTTSLYTHTRGSGLYP
jgi:hypothetical protein